MEVGFGTYFTDVILLNAVDVDMQKMKRLIRHADWEGSNVLRRYRIAS